MRDLRRNQGVFSYSLLVAHELEETGEKYTDKNGNTYDMLDGTEEVDYSDKVEFRASFRESGAVDFQPYGLNVSDYDLTLSTSKELPITETSLIYRAEREYSVVKIIRSLNETVYVLKENKKWNKEQQAL